MSNTSSVVMQQDYITLRESPAVADTAVHYTILIRTRFTSDCVSRNSMQRINPLCALDPSMGDRKSNAHGSTEAHDIVPGSHGSRFTTLVPIGLASSLHISGTNTAAPLLACTGS